MADLGKTLIGGDLTVIDDTVLGGSLFIVDKLGVGIKTPTEVLDVVGNIKLTGGIKTSASILDFLSSDDSHIGVKAKSLVLASSPGPITAPANGAYIQGNVGIGKSPSHPLDVNGNIQLSGQFRSTYSTAGLPPFVITSSVMVPNLNSDKIDNYEAKDIFNSVIDITGYGVVKGLKVTAVASTTKVNVSAGTVLIKDYGYMSISSNDWPGFTPGNKHIVFVVGKTATEGGKPRVAGEVAVEIGNSTNYPDMSIFTNPIILAKVDLPAGQTMQNAHIYPCRKFVNIVSFPLNNDLSPSDDEINILPTDKDTVNVTSSNVIGRVNIKPNGNSTLLTVSNVPAPGTSDESLKLIEISPDFIKFKISDINEQSITHNKIQTWDNAGLKQHMHVYDGSYIIDVTRKILTIDNNPETPVSDPDSVRVYINGLRNKKGFDYNITKTSPKVELTFYSEISIIDNVVVDYDI